LYAGRFRLSTPYFQRSIYIDVENLKPWNFFFDFRGLLQSAAPVGVAASAMGGLYGRSFSLSTLENDKTDIFSKTPSILRRHRRWGCGKPLFGPLAPPSRSTPYFRRIARRFAASRLS
jgi:hypothetical protein